MVALSAATAQTNNLANVYVASVTVVPPGPEWNDTQPRNGAVVVVVGNDGTGPVASYTLTYRWAGENAALTFLNGDQAHSTDVSNRSLAAGDTHEWHVPWTLQNGQQGNGRVRATISSSNPERTTADNSLQSDTFFIARHSIAVSVLGDPRTIGPDEWRFYRLRIVNSGNTPETVSLELDGPAPPGVEASIQPSTVTVPAGSVAGAHLYLQYARPDPQSPFDAPLRVWANASYGASLLRATPPLRSVSTSSSQGHAMHLGPPTPPVEYVDAGASVATSIRLHNDGQQPDTYVIASSSSPGWTATASPNRLALFPQETALVHVSVSAPADTPAGGPGWANIHVASDHWLPSASANLSLRASGAAMLLTKPELAAAPYAGTNVTILATLANAGNQATPSTSFLRWNATRPNGVAVDPYDIPTSDLAAGANVPVPFDFDPGSEGGLAEVSATWYPAPGAAPGTSASTSFLVHAPDLEVTPPQGLAGAPGQALGYDAPPHVFRVANRGNAPEQVVIEATTDAGAAAVHGDTEFLLQPGASRSVAVTHHLPRPAGALNESRVYLAARVLGVPHANASANATTLIRDVEHPQLVWDPSTASVWTLNRPYELVVLATDDGQLHLVAANATGPALQASGLPLASHGSRPDAWTRTFAALEAGTYRFTVAARDAAGHWASLPDHRVEVAAYAAPHVRLATPVDAPLTATQSLDFDLDDPLGIRSVVLRVYQGDSLIAAPRASAWNDTHARFPVDGLPPGPWTGVMEAENGAGVAAHLTFGFQVAARPTTSAAEDNLTAGAPLEGQAAAQPTPGPPAAFALLAAACALLGRRGPPRRRQPGA